jgi:hypothetical protein
MLPMTLGYQGAYGKVMKSVCEDMIWTKPCKGRIFGIWKTEGVPLWPPQGNKETKEWLCRWTHSRLTYLASQGHVPSLTHTHTHTHSLSLSLSLSLNCTKLFNTFLLCKGKRKILRKYMYCWWLGLLLILPQIVLITIATTNDMIKISSSSHVILEHMEWACYVISTSWVTK